MVWKCFAQVMLTVSLVMSVPLAVVAQDGAIGPEGGRWDLIAYGADGLGPVPWNVDATITLEGGTVSGSTGCDRLSGDYELAADTLTLASALDRIGETCVGDAAAVEAGYLAALPLVATWAIVDDELQLSDESGSIILVFARPVVGLTAHDIAGLTARLDNLGADLERLDRRMDAIRVGRLRERIKDLEAEVARLKRPAAAGGTSAVSFSAAEKTLLAAIPSRIRRTCTPRRDQNPTGTVAAVQCKPETAKVRDMAYYLIPGRRSQKVWQERMDAYGVKPRDRACTNGKQGHVMFTGGIQAAGCYVNEDGRANLRYLDQPWKECSALNIAGTRVDDPVMYIAVLGPDDDLATLTGWAEPRKDARPRALYERVGAITGCVPRPPM